MASVRASLATIQRSPAAAKAIVRGFGPPRHMKAVLEATAHSIRVAHAASPDKWGIRLNRRSVMLKVGFVEVLQFGDS